MTDLESGARSDEYRGRRRRRDGILDVLWGAGATSNGPDHLYVTDVQTKTIRWSNTDLVGPSSDPRSGTSADPAPDIGSSVP
jgi:hypothetical protein